MPRPRNIATSKRVVVTLPAIMHDLIDMKAAKLGRKVTDYIRDLIVDDIEHDEQLHKAYQSSKAASQN